MELDKDIRTVFLYNLNLKAQERDIFELFSRAGKVVDVRIIMDRNTRKSKGFAYIELLQVLIPLLYLSIWLAWANIVLTAAAWPAGGHHQRIESYRAAPSWTACDGEEFRGMAWHCLLSDSC